MTTFQFRPKVYYGSLGLHEPVLHLSPGDRVITTTLDANGRDETGNRVVETGNPMTGPFYLDGAEPGDVLVLHLERIMPNRPFGWTSHVVASNVVEPYFVTELYQYPKDQPYMPAIWEIDTNTWTATLNKPETKLGRFSLPLAPMLGCFGVAPEDGQSISTATSGPHGGNMDYRGFAEGVTVYLPVSVPGALLYLGDGHAVQGDGEIVGTGIEVTLEVEFSVDLIKGRSIQWPRGEDEDFIFTAGNARPLDQALQYATTEMLRWLQSDYDLDAQSAVLFIGQTVQYEVGNVFDPAYTMICKIPKKALKAIPPA